MEKTIDLFVPGRLCLMGEHSDWAGSYRKINNKIEKGYAIVTGIEEGIYATVSKSSDLIVEYKDKSKETFKAQMDVNKLKKIAEEGGFWSYVAGVASCIKEQYNIGGVKIVINEVTIPIKKGLSSSAAICVLVARAFNLIYNLKLNTIGEMNMAYLGEIETPSRCGRLDQACAFGKKPILMTFDGDKLKVEEIKIGSNFYFVFADLMSKKDTIKILGDLNKSFPFASNEIEENVQKGLGIINKENIFNGLKCIENGDLPGFGNIMNKAQEDFDKFVMPACYSELEAKILHETMNNETIKKLIYGAKGVGSQGDGTIQFLAKNKESQDALVNYLNNELKMRAYHLTIEKTSPIKKAIIPVAGNGTRMYPITKVIKKPFLPIIDENNIIKPAFMQLLEELDDAGIEKIALVIDKDERESFREFFEKTTNPDILSKLSHEMLEYESKVYRIGNKIEYIVQTEKRGLGHAVSLCNKFAGDDPVLLLLGDQLYKTANAKSCTQQLIENFSKTNKATVSVCEVDLENVSRYGILTGKVDDNNNYFIVDKMTEKPQIDIAEEKLYTYNNNEKKYYAVFGEYVLTKEIFDILEYNVTNNVCENGEIQITNVLDQLCSEKKLVAYIPDGKMLDIGNVVSYRNCIMDLSKK